MLFPALTLLLDIGDSETTRWLYTSVFTVLAVYINMAASMTSARTPFIKASRSHADARTMHAPQHQLVTNYQNRTPNISPIQRRVEGACGDQRLNLCYRAIWRKVRIRNEYRPNAAPRLSANREDQCSRVLLGIHIDPSCVHQRTYTLNNNERASMHAFRADRNPASEVRY